MGICLRTGIPQWGAVNLLDSSTSSFEKFFFIGRNIESGDVKLNLQLQVLRLKPDEMVTMNEFDNIEVAPRYQTAETAHIEVYGRMGHLVGQMRNISQTGAFFELTNGDYIPGDGDILHLTVHLHSIKKTHYVDAEVKWKRGLQFGVHFVSKEQVLDKMFNKSPI